MSVCLRMWLKLSCSTHGSPLLKLARYQGGGRQEKQGELATFQWHWACKFQGENHCKRMYKITSDSAVKHAVLLKRGAGC